MIRFQPAIGNRVRITFHHRLSRVARRNRLVRETIFLGETAEHRKGVIKVLTRSGIFLKQNREQGLRRKYHRKQNIGSCLLKVACGAKKSKSFSSGCFTPDSVIALYKKSLLYKVDSSTAEERG